MVFAFLSCPPWYRRCIRAFPEPMKRRGTAGVALVWYQRLVDALRAPITNRCVLCYSLGDAVVALGWHTKTPNRSDVVARLMLERAATSASASQRRPQMAQTRQRHANHVLADAVTASCAPSRVAAHPLLSWATGRRPRHQVDFVCSMSKTRPRLSGLTSCLIDSGPRARQPFANVWEAGSSARVLTRLLTRRSAR